MPLRVAWDEVEDCFVDNGYFREGRVGVVELEDYSDLRRR